jgi:hypothetical protein
MLQRVRKKHIIKISCPIAAGKEFWWDLKKFFARVKIVDFKYHNQIRLGDGQNGQ